MEEMAGIDCREEENGDSTARTEEKFRDFRLTNLIRVGDGPRRGNLSLLRLLLAGCCGGGALLLRAGRQERRRRRSRTP
jgi:hypothetical protein